MNDIAYLVLDFEKICRLCLQETGVMSDIFDRNSEIQIKDLILCAIGLQTSEDDGLPSKICHKCRYVIELSCEMQDKAMKSYQFLLSASEATPPSDLLDVVDLNCDKNGLIKSARLKKKNKLSTQKEIESTKVKWIDYEYVNKENKELENNFNCFLSMNKKRTPKHLTCQICLTTCTTVEQVKLHVNSHYKGTDLTPYLNIKCPYKCEECGESPLSKKELVLHHRRHLNVNPYVCKFPGCEYIGKSHDTLRHHLTGHGDRRVVCAACDRSYRRMNELRQHEQRAHSQAPRAACPICRKTFRNRYTYRSHLKMHSDKPKHRCEQSSCGKSFRTASALAAHERGHAQQRPHQCHVCGAAYTTLALLNRHMRAHQRADARRRVCTDAVAVTSTATVDAVASAAASQLTCATQATVLSREAHRT